MKLYIKIIGFNEYFEKQQVGKKWCGNKLTAHFAKKVKTNENASSGDQVHFRRLLARWTARSLRPFSVTEDAGLQDVIDFATSINPSATQYVTNSSFFNF